MMRPFRVRFTVRRAMVVTAIVAVALSGWAAVERGRLVRDQNAVGREMAWCLESTNRFVWPSEGLRGCLVKISALDGPGREGRYLPQTLALGEDGAFMVSHDKDGGGLGTQQALPPSRLAPVGPILSAMPPSAGDLPPGRVVLVGFRVHGEWTARAYDRAAPPKEVRRLLGALGLSRW